MDSWMDAIDLAGMNKVHEFWKCCVWIEWSVGIVTSLPAIMVSRCARPARRRVRMLIYQKIGPTDTAATAPPPPPQPPPFVFPF